MPTAHKQGRAASGRGTGGVGSRRAASESRDGQQGRRLEGGGRRRMQPKKKGAGVGEKEGGRGSPSVAVGCRRSRRKEQGWRQVEQVGINSSRGSGSAS